ncbi:MAG: Carbamoyl-phosphate synthase small chain [Candidatus Moanabacter tarae]|uniref:Carbamoyl phosphate synthase small chain n=1 Tax=Candidatus Moanibacter tarae TaxID=2200854 RepID=A0A2Z4AHS1_9BACT|nr:MAG: Carbamoyl-phosphate synthase small chain [Candidatus Moanabacter tarae]|tara:strand:+ start:30356 stop:31420 length:1065 start_codon:yes stop_codon:yes gene_type:complete
MINGKLVLENGIEFKGQLFGAPGSSAGEVVFNTGMVGYPEALTDPSYHGQILTLTYPLVGNYGVPSFELDEDGLPMNFESNRIQVSGLIISTASFDSSHWTAECTLDDWFRSCGVPILSGIDTRELTKTLRDKGTMLGKIVPEGEDIPFHDPNIRNLVAEVSISEPEEYGTQGPRVVLIDTGVKASIIRCLVKAGARVLRVPWDYDFFDDEYDGIFLSNGPGDPKLAEATIANLSRALKGKVPIFGICLGNQLLALAAGADTYKLKFGHRAQNQPCQEVGATRCYVTSQNHGFAVDASTLPDGWRQWFINLNDQTNEGIRHEWKPIRSVQFHPEATPGPTDTVGLFDRFVDMIS